MATINFKIFLFNGLFYAHDGFVMPNTVRAWNLLFFCSPQNPEPAYRPSRSRHGIGYTGRSSLFLRRLRKQTITHRITLVRKGLIDPDGQLFPLALRPFAKKGGAQFAHAFPCSCATALSAQQRDGRTHFKVSCRGGLSGCPANSNSFKPMNSPL